MSKPVVLVVDDDPDQRRVLAAVLVEEASVVEASDGESALAFLAQESPALVILDLSMPGLSGFEVLKRVRELRPSTNVIMLTSRADLGAAREALRDGATAYMTKPFDVERLRAEVARLAIPERREESPWRIAR